MDGDEERPRIRPSRLLVDSWEDGDDRNVLFVAQGTFGATAVVLTHSPSGHFWEGGAALLEDFPDSYDRDSLLAAVPTRGLTREDMAAAGLFGGTPLLGGELASAAERMQWAGKGLVPTAVAVLARKHALGHDVGSGPWAEHVPLPGPRPGVAEAGRGDPEGFLGFLPVREDMPMPRANALEEHLRSGRDALPGHVRLQDHGYWRDDRRTLVLERAHPDVTVAAGDAVPHTAVDLSGTDIPGVSHRTALHAASAAVAERRAFLAGPSDAAALEVLGPKHWNERAHAFLSRGGRVGERRRQAARLYPAFAVTVAADAHVGMAVDAGRPFEAALLANLAGMAYPATRSGLTLAALRRLRALPPSTRIFDIAAAVEVAAQMPVDWLPRDAAGWKVAVAVARPLLEQCRFLGTRLDDLAHHVSGDLARLEASVAASRPAALDQDERLRNDGRLIVGGMPPHVEALRAARDMADRMASTLVAQACASLGIRAGQGDARRIAGRMLFAGKSLPAVDRLQRDWHGGIARQDAALPAHEAGNSWPRAFAPFAAPNGLVVAFLTDEAQLKAEGARGPDADGIRGLDHCVGGYGRQCHRGDALVASVRRPVGESFERVSTVELRAIHEGDRVRLGVAQHYGERNGPPSDAALAALAAFQDAVGAGLHPVEAEALERRTGQGFLDAYDWRTPGAMEAAFDAWKEYLPREVAAGGLPALLGRVEEEAAFLASVGEDVDLPEPTAPDLAEEGPRPAP